MVKKLKKYVKFVVCCALMLSLMAPSYAALSASDGSAFVTKAEFDSALADFNSRLTTFEAGINSKIDSQVTSYLDRNGIWSGKEQNLLCSAGVADNRFPDRTWYCEGASMKTGNLTMKALEYVICYPYNKNICKSNKTGLFYLKFKFLGSADNSVAMNRFTTSATAGSLHSSFYWQAGVGSSIIKNRILKTQTGSNPQVAIDKDMESLSDIRWSFCLFSATQMATTLYANYPLDSGYSSLFFVNKDDFVWLRGCLIVTAGSGNVTWDESQSNFWSSTDAYRPYVVLEEYKIY